MVNVRTAFILYIFPNKPGSICRFADQEKKALLLLNNSFKDRQGKTVTAFP